MTRLPQPFRAFTLWGLTLTTLLPTTPVGLFAADASQVVSAAAPASAAEVAYWKKLQAELTAFRSANRVGDAKLLLLADLNDINAIMARTEDFLDARDADPVDDLGSDLIAYREQLLAMLDSALNPLRAAASFQEQLARFNMQERVIQITRYQALMRVVDEYKASLARLQNSINASVVAAGGARIEFFRNLNFGDETYLVSNGLSPLERDARFVDESRAIDPGFAVIAEEKFLAWRRDGRIKAELEAKRDDILGILANIGEDVKRQPPAQLEEQLATPPPGADPFDVAMVQTAIRLEQTRRERQSAYALKLLDWKAAFARWIGDATDEAAAWNACRDVAVSFDGSRYAYTSDGHTVIVRDASDNTVAASSTFDGDVRGLAFDADQKLMVFATDGLMQWDLPAGTEPVRRNSTASPSITGRITTAAAMPRYFYAWANLPEISDAGSSSTLRAAGSSLISAVQLDPTGRFVAIGYTGQNNLGGSAKTRNGVDLLSLPETMGNGSIGATKYALPFVDSVTSAAFSADSKLFAVASVYGSAHGSLAIWDRETGPTSRRMIRLDDQPYHYVAFTSGDSPRLFAASRNGMLRLFDAADGRLLALTQAPVGPEGVAVGLHGDTLVTVALGADQVQRWSTADLTPLETVAGESPALDAAALAARLTAEQALAPTVAAIVDLVAAKGDDAIALGRTLIREQSPALNQLGRRANVLALISDKLADKIDGLREKGELKASADLGLSVIREGIATIAVYYDTVACLRQANRLDEADALASEGLQLFPSSTKIRFQYHRQRMASFSAKGDTAAALAAIDEIGEVDPQSRPNNNLRIAVFYEQAQKAEARKDETGTLKAYLEAFKYCTTESDQLNFIPTIYSLAYRQQQWQLCVNIANLWMKLDPKKENDEKFLATARYAYGKTQK